MLGELCRWWYELFVLAKQSDCLLCTVVLESSPPAPPKSRFCRRSKSRSGLSPPPSFFWHVPRPTVSLQLVSAQSFLSEGHVLLKDHVVGWKIARPTMQPIRFFRAHDPQARHVWHSPGQSAAPCTCHRTVKVLQ